MKGTRVLTAAALAAVMICSLTAAAHAWEPKGIIKKYVQNQTTNSARADADSETNALTAKPGDILKYIIEIHNNGSGDNGNENDMRFTKLTDTLPAGVELMSNPSKRELNEELGIIPAGQSITREYIVRVTATIHKTLIDNKACFTGNSEPEDNPQEGCDTAKVVISNPPKEPPKPEEPKEEPKSEQPKSETVSSPKAQPQALPKAGPSDAAFPAVLGATIAGYLGHMLISKRRS